MEVIAKEIEKLSELFVLDYIRFIDEIVKEVMVNKNYDTEPIWNLESMVVTSLDENKELTSSLSLINENDYEAIHAPLQYAKDEIEICNICYSARYVVMYSIMHLEETIKCLLRKNLILGKIRLSNLTIEKSLYRLKHENLLPEYLLEGFNTFARVKKIFDSNKNDFDLFSARDSLIVFFSSRILAAKTLCCFYSNINSLSNKETYGYGRNRAL